MRRASGGHATGSLGESAEAGTRKYVEGLLWIMEIRGRQNNNNNKLLLIF